MNEGEKEEKENKDGEKKNVPCGPTTGESDILRVRFS